MLVARTRTPEVTNRSFNASAWPRQGRLIGGGNEFTLSHGRPASLEVAILDETMACSEGLVNEVLDRTSS